MPERAHAPRRSSALERLQALDPADPRTPQALLDIVSEVDAAKVSAQEAATICDEVNRLTHAVNKALGRR